ncbi:SDR family oxidoreductase [Pseudonocardia ailaonensis]|uniref:SDR family oxidoreductase n=1 Tax=Pseudonocardia ailaonensis TaxID=367279 RepID=A0ABN2N409_9PSEU
MSEPLAKGHVAVVTGGGSGIGRATALLFAAEGATAVAVADINEASAAETATLVGELGVASFAMATDVGSAAEIDAFAAATQERFGPLTAAVNCVGVNGPYVPIGEYSDEDWNRVIDINLNGIFRCMRSQVRYMTSEAGGAIVNVSSGAAASPIPDMAAYSTSKRGILAVSRAAAGEYVKAGIRINAILPGPIMTPMLQSHASTGHGAQRVSNHPMGRSGTPEEVAEVAVWLCSRRASFVTGVELPVDGGLHQFRQQH